jgi:hypothetical protein
VSKERSAFPNVDCSLLLAVLIVHRLPPPTDVKQPVKSGKPAEAAAADEAAGAKGKVKELDAAKQRKRA